MIRAVLICVLLLAGCSQDDSQAPTDDHPAAAMLDDAATKGLATAYLGCVQRVALQTPNGRDAMDLKRIDVVLAGCTSDEQAALDAAARRWSSAAAHDSDAERRRSLRAEAVKVVRRNPYEPPLVVIKAVPDADPLAGIEGLRGTGIEVISTPPPGSSE